MTPTLSFLARSRSAATLLNTSDSREFRPQRDQSDYIPTPVSLLHITALCKKGERGLLDKCSSLFKKDKNITLGMSNAFYV